MIKTPLNFTCSVKDERTRRLVKQVWQRLPAHDRHALRELVLDVSDGGHSDSETLASTFGADPSSGDGCAAQVAEELPHVVSLARVKEIESDAARMFVIAHEFAHVVLRHFEISVVVQGLQGLDIYTDTDLNALKEWCEDEADLLAWLWGFKTELQAFLDAYPEARRPRWYVTLTWERGG